MRIHKIAALVGAAAMAVTALGATAASASTGPGNGESSGSMAPAAAAQHVSGPTYIEMHMRGGGQAGYYAPSKFWLKGGGSAQIFTTGTYWSGYGKKSAVGSGPMWGVRYGHTVYVGHVTMRFSDRKTNCYFTATGKQCAYFENVRISGIQPGNGGSVQNWHWSWHAHNWVFGG